MKLDAEQLEELKQRTPIVSLLNQFGYKVKGRYCLCPFGSHPSTSACEVYKDEGRIFCHRCGIGGDQFDLLKIVKNMSFMEAVSFMGGPRELSPDDRRKFAEDRKKIEAAEAEKAKKDHEKARKLFETGVEIKGTLAATYLRNRGLTVSKRMWFDLRYIDKLLYRGFADPRASEETDLGEFPAMLAAVRHPETNAHLGTHRTYLEPGTAKKLTPPGDLKRNAAKKGFGAKAGGIVFLSPPADTLILGEGIETSLSGYELDLGGREAAVAAAIDLYNLCGSPTGMLQNPKFPNDPTRRIPNCIPDPDRPGLMPPRWARKVILLGDGDSEFVWTRAMVGTAAQRFVDVDRTVKVVFAPENSDFNTVLMAEQ